MSDSVPGRSFSSPALASVLPEQWLWAQAVISLREKS